MINACVSLMLKACPKGINVRMGAWRALSSHHMKVPYQSQTILMREPIIKKNCQRCALSFDIPNIKESKARELLLQFKPCTHCGFVESSKYQKSEKSGRCMDCSIPFSIVDHHSNGRCKRCDMRNLRHKSKPI